MFQCLSVCLLRATTALTIQLRLIHLTPTIVITIVLEVGKVKQRLICLEF